MKIYVKLRYDDQIRFVLSVAACVITLGSITKSQPLEQLSYNHPDLLVDLGVGLTAYPLPIDFNGNGLTDLIMLDHEGYLALFRRVERNGEIVLLPGERVFQLEGEESPLRLQEGITGRSGRRKIAISDFDGDGRPDILVNSLNASFLRNIGKENGVTVFRDEGLLSEHPLVGHTTQPTIIDLTGDGIPELLIGTEDGFFYYLGNPFID